MILPSDPDRRVTSADGTPIGYWTIGRGPALLLVHGLGVDHDRWRPLGDRLKDRFRVCLMDRRGRNGSGDRLPYALEREVDDICAVAEDAGPIVVLGHSFAGPIAMEAARRSAGIIGVINYEGWPTIEGAVPSGLIDRLDALVAAGDYEGAYTLDDPPEIVEELRADPMWASRVAAAFTLPRELSAWERYWEGNPGYGDLTQPCLLVMGGENEPLYRPWAEAFMTGHPSATSRVVTGQGHQAHRHAPELMAEVLLPFLQSMTGEESQAAASA
ncbi:MAG TPA: alpha/beta hydrolase [Candidatus Limnocylindria bacterium]